MVIAPRFQSLMRLNEVAEYLQVSERTIRRMVDDGRLTARKVGRQWRFRKEDVDRLSG